MNEDLDPRMIDAAGAIADGTPVTWSSSDSSVSPEEDPYRGLRVLELVASAHRALPAAESLQSTTVLAPNIESRRWGSLELRDRIGEGAFGEVYRAFDSVLRREVALKLRKPRGEDSHAATDRLLEEARRLARVRHAGVIAIYGAEEHQGRLGIWMELIRGHTLENILAQRGPLGATEAGAIGIDLCRALAAVHGAGLVHRDVKTANVMRESGGRIVLMDFGSGRDFAPGGDPIRSQHVHGTPLVMAPEQLRGEVAGAATDIYGLGALLYHLVTGRYPIEAGTMYDLMEGHERRRAVPLRDRRPDLPTAFVRVVEQAMAFDPGQRFATAGEMERALASALVAEPPAPRRTSPVLAAGVAVALLGVAVTAAMLIVRGSSPQSAQPPRIDETPRVVTTAPRVESGSPPNATESSKPLRARKPRGPDLPAVAEPQASAAEPAKGPVPVSTAPASARLVVAAELYRRRNGVETRLVPGSTISPGDHLTMSVETARPIYLYVLDEDAEGAINVLFPLPGLETQNPIASNSPIRLPGLISGRPIDWQVTSAGGTETILAIASSKPLSGLESELAAMPHASYATPVSEERFSSAVRSVLRSIGGLASADEAGAGQPSARLNDAIQNALQIQSGEEVPWFWQIQLSNPRP